MINFIKDNYYKYKQDKLIRNPLKKYLDYLYTFDIVEIREFIFKAVELFFEHGGIEGVDWSFHNMENIIKNLKCYIERRKKYKIWKDKINNLDNQTDKSCETDRFIDDFLYEFDKKYLHIIIDYLNYFWT